MSETELMELLRDKYDKMLLTKKETAEELNISTMTLDRLRQTGAIRSKKIGGGVFFTLDEIARFVYE